MYFLGLGRWEEKGGWPRLPPGMWESLGWRAFPQCGLTFSLFAVESGLWERVWSLSSTWGEERHGKLLGILRTPSSDPDILVSTLQKTILLFIPFTQTCEVLHVMCCADVKRACLNNPGTFLFFFCFYFLFIWIATVKHLKKRFMNCLLVPGAGKKGSVVAQLGRSSLSIVFTPWLRSWRLLCMGIKRGPFVTIISQYSYHGGWGE